jgi:hypothetical protein
MRSTSLQTKFLLVLNGMILAVWCMYAAWTLHKTEEQFMRAEVSSIEHLAVGLGLLVEHHLSTHRSIAGLQGEIESLLSQQKGLDIMLIDRSFIVQAATQKDRIGRKWFETGINAVLQGDVRVVVGDNEHHHLGRRAIDATVAVHNPSGERVYVVHAARWLDHIGGALGEQVSKRVAKQLRALDSKRPWPSIELGASDIRLNADPGMLEQA